MRHSYAPIGPPVAQKAPTIMDGGVFGKHEPGAPAHNHDAAGAPAPDGVVRAHGAGMPGPRGDARHVAQADHLHGHGGALLRAVTELPVAVVSPAPDGTAAAQDAVVPICRGHLHGVGDAVDTHRGRGVLGRQRDANARAGHLDRGGAAVKRRLGIRRIPGTDVVDLAVAQRAGSTRPHPDTRWTLGARSGTRDDLRRAATADGRGRGGSHAHGRPPPHQGRPPRPR
jgi:hypothetical protein